ncbi:hypothetical protein [Paraglaciecola sp. L3A3]|uniref:hypothetical protein n=1 Tax=Paraglaciecola sp. L3A3 TaxID=2686358 RepID=UPI00131C4315|nr:hypothetical protein [Paraglaciecola sp. L3A3]
MFKNSPLRNLLILILLITFPSIAEESIPDQLSDWQAWVLKDKENLTCPFINQSDYRNEHNHICVWPSTLDIQVDSQGATFQQSWKVLSKSKVPLLGNNKYWPFEIKVNGKNTPIFSKNGMPFIELEKGNYSLEGKLSWQSIPASITLSKQTALVNMSINGRAINFPKINNNELWFQESTQDQADQETLDIRVVRKVSDGPYIALKTIISVDVSGKIREVPLGHVLPKNFDLIGIQSETPAFLDADGVLHAKLKPGNWEIIVNAYSAPTNLIWQRPAQSQHWPKDEVWVFETNEKLRFGKLSGASVIDSGQVEMPQAWYQYPAYLLTENNSLNYDIQHRGKPLHLENQLSLERTFWLSFDNKQLSFKDKVTGSMVEGWRLGMPAPFILESAEDQDGPVLITSLTEGERGLENRYSMLDVNASGMVSATSTLPITGWKSDFERVSIKLNLPPGNKLFAVFGTDRVSDSWWSRWSIWASFIVLLASLAAYRLSGLVAGILTALMLVVVYQENSAPVIAILNLLVAIAIRKHQPFEKLKSIAKIYWAASAAIVVAAILLFSANQLRTVIHPQLETGNRNMYSQDAENYADTDIIRMRKPTPAPSQSASISTMNLGKAKAEAEAELRMVTESGARMRQADSFIERYQSDALLQAGSGTPNWSWNQYTLSWNSPIAQDQTFELIILSKTTNKILKLLGIVLMLLWLFFLLKDAIQVTIDRFKHKSAIAFIGVFCLMPIYTPPAQANSFPSQAMLEELKSRLLEAPNCAPDCASINSLGVSAKNDTLSLNITVHANSQSALALPTSEFWQGQSFTLNNKPLLTVYRQNNWLYIPVAAGVSTLVITGRLIPVDNFQLRFKDKPKRVVIEPSDSWDIVGAQGNILAGNSLEFLAKIKANQEDSPASTRFKQPAYVKVSRVLTIDKMWTVNTVVERIAPAVGSLNLQIPILTGEHVISDEVTVKNNHVAVSISAGENKFTWSSTLERHENMQLTADSKQNYIEQWQIVISPSWHLSLDGLPMIMEKQNAFDYFNYSFYPYAGESLNLDISRPKAVKGEALAIDSVKVDIDLGTRTSKLELAFNYRSTRGGEHFIDLPADYQLKEVKTDGRTINLQPEAGKLAIPISPGTHHIQITMRSTVENLLSFSPPVINLNAPSSNITTQVNVSNQRWILWAKGPLLGPAILYWGELLAFILIALLLARVKFSPLNTGQWLILGFGLSLNNWGVLVLIALWFSAITASQYRPKDIKSTLYNFSQLCLYVFSAVAILSLIAVVPISLLSKPSMGIEGYESYGNTLTWFADKADNQLPTITILSISVWFYKAIMLVWVIWLSTSILSWIKWAWSSLGVNGYWQASSSKSKKNDSSLSLTEKDR